MNSKTLKTLFMCLVLFFSIFFINTGHIIADSGGTGMADDTARNKGTDRNKTNNSGETTTTSDAHGSTNSGVCYYEWNVDGDPYLLQITFMKSSQSYKSFKAVTKFENKKTKSAAKITNFSDIFSAYNIGAHWVPYLTNAGTGGDCLTDALYKKDTGGCGSITWNCPDSVFYKYEGDNKFSLHYTEKEGYTNGDWTSEYKASDEAKDIYGNDEDWDQTEDEKSKAGWDINISDIAFDDYSQNAGDKDCGLIPNSIIKFLNNLFLIIQVIGILLLVVLTIVEFVKVITTAAEDGLGGAIKNTFRRIIMVILLLIIRPLIIWILGLISVRSCM